MIKKHLSTPSLHYGPSNLSAKENSIDQNYGDEYTSDPECQLLSHDRVVDCCHSATEVSPEPVRKKVERKKKRRAPQPPGRSVSMRVSDHKALITRTDSESLGNLAYQRSDSGSNLVSCDTINEAASRSRLLLDVKQPSTDSESLSDALTQSPKSPEGNHLSSFESLAFQNSPSQSPREKSKLKALQRALASPRNVRKNSKKYINQENDGATNFRVRKNATIEPPDFSLWTFVCLPENFEIGCEFEINRVARYDEYLTDQLNKTDVSQPEFADLCKASKRVNAMVQEKEYNIKEIGSAHNTESLQKYYPSDDLQVSEQPQAQMVQEKEDEIKDTMNNEITEMVQRRFPSDDIQLSQHPKAQMVQEKEDEIKDTMNNEITEMVQRRFPSDDLQLSQHPKAQKKRGISTRRKSAPSAVLFKTLGGNRNLNTMGKKDNEMCNTFSSKIDTNRMYIMEGPVQFSNDPQTTHYLFLFDDLLIIAKQKTNTIFKLKHRVLVSSLWIDTCIEELLETTKQQDRAFIIGWPTRNIVAIFKETETKDLWMLKLTKQIQQEKLKEKDKIIQLKIINRTSNSPNTCTVQVNNTDSVRDVLKACMEKFHISESEQKDYQLWVLTGPKEGTVYPLIGHENPYAIKQSHLRSSGDIESEPYTEMESNSKCEFFLKRKKSTSKRGQDYINQRGTKRHRRPAILQIFHRRSREDKSLAVVSPVESGGSVPVGKLFGHPLEAVCTEGYNPAKAVIDMLKVCYIKGARMEGFLRKSANFCEVKVLREKLDNGELVDLENYSALTIGAIFKDYLRSIPKSLLIDEYMAQWLEIGEMEDSEEKLEKTRQLLQRLPLANIQLLKLLICMLCHVVKYSNENQMNSVNVAVCIAPSILIQKNRHDLTALSPTKPVQYLIEKAVNIFGSRILRMFDEYIENSFISESSDTDSLNSLPNDLRHDDSSVESLVDRDLFSDVDNITQQGNSQLSNLSHDSGLMLSDGLLNEEEVEGEMKIKKSINPVCPSPLQYTSDNGSFDGYQQPSSVSQTEGYLNFSLSITPDMSSDDRDKITEKPYNSDIRDKCDEEKSKKKSKVKLRLNTESSSQMSISSEGSLPDTPEELSNDATGCNHKSQDQADIWTITLSLDYKNENTETINRDPLVQHDATVISQTSKPPIAVSYYRRDSEEEVHEKDKGGKKELAKYTSLGSPPPNVVLRQFATEKGIKRTSSLAQASETSSVRNVQRNRLESSQNSMGKEDTFNSHHYKRLSKINPEAFVNPEGKKNDVPSARPPKPPTYIQALHRKSLLEKGLNVEIPEAMRQKEASLRAKELYEQSLKEYSSAERKAEPPDEYVVLTKDPKKIYYDSLKLYEEQKKTSEQDEPDSSRTCRKIPVISDTNQAECPVRKERSYKKNIDTFESNANTSHAISRRKTKVKSSQNLPWSVSNLKNVFDPGADKLRIAEKDNSTSVQSEYENSQINNSCNTNHKYIYKGQGVTNCGLSLPENLDRGCNSSKENDWTEKFSYV